MRRPMVLAAVLATVFAATANAADIPIDHVSLPVPSDKTVHLKFPVGSLRVEASSDRQVSFELSGHCRRWWGDDCRDRAERIHIRSESSDGQVDLSVKGYPKMNAGGFELRGVLRLPAELALKVDMGVGEVDIRDIEGDLDVDLGVGDANIHAPDRAVRSVDVNTGVGDADVVARGSRVRRHGFISSSASWDEGRGRSTVSLHVGVGDGTVRLD